MAALGSSVDIESSCGYLTLVTVPKEEKKREVKGGKDSSASDSRRKEDRESSPAGAELNSSNAQLLEEELDNIDCPMAGSQLTSSMTKSSILPPRPTDLQLGVKVEPLEKNCSWQLLDVTFGIPLFDMDLNAAVTQRQDSKSEKPWLSLEFQVDREGSGEGRELGQAE